MVFQKLVVIELVQLIEMIEKAMEEDRTDFVKDVLVRYIDLKRIYSYEMTVIDLGINIRILLEEVIADILLQEIHVRLVVRFNTGNIAPVVRFMLETIVRSRTRSF